jgi:hypothetical protein
MNELQILINQQSGVITTNFEDIKTSLSDQMQIYKELVVTEENKTERKKDVATLRKMVKAVNDKKVDVKNEFMKPYTTFEQNVKELIDIINEPISIIDNQVKEYEEKQRLAKQDTIKALFLEMIIDYPDCMQDEIQLDTVYDNRWENATASMKSVKEEMTVKLDTIKNNVAIIQSMVSDKTAEALNLFWGDLDFTKAIVMINRYEAQKKEIEARVSDRQKKEQAEAIDREIERARKAERDAIEREKQAKQAEHDAMVVKQQNADTEKRLYGIDATQDEFEQIEMYFNSLGISFERV